MRPPKRLVVGITSAVLVIGAGAGFAQAAAKGDGQQAGPAALRDGAGPGPGAKTIADYLGLTAAELRTQLQAGKTLADLAKAQGKTVSGLEDAIVADAKAHLDAAVTAGKLTGAQAAARLADLNSHVDDMVNRTGPGPGGPGGRGHHGGPFDLAAVTGYLGLTAAELRTQLESGKSLADVAKAQSKTSSGLQDAIVAAATKKLDAAVAAGKLTAAQEETMLADLESHVGDMVNRTGPPLRGPDHGPRRRRCGCRAAGVPHDRELAARSTGSGRAHRPAPSRAGKCRTTPSCHRPPLRLPSLPEAISVLESPLGVDAEGAAPLWQRWGPVSGFRRATKLVAFSSATTEGATRRCASTFRSTTSPLSATDLAARLPSRPPGGAKKHDELEERCRLYLQALRWPGGVECPRCDESDRLLWLDSREKWHCYSCRYQFSVTAGTLFHSSHLPLWKWFVSVQLMTESRHGISANQLRHVLGGSYKTFWFTTHRIRVAMRGRGQPLLRDVVGDMLSRGRSSPALTTTKRQVPGRLRRGAALHRGEPGQPARLPRHDPRPRARRGRLL